MHDDQLLQDLELQRQYTENTIDLLRRHGITTYSRLFALLRDENADIRLREAGCRALMWVREKVDKRRAVPPLLVVFQSGDVEAQRAAAVTLGMLNSRRAVLPLLSHIANKSLPAWSRAGVISSLCLIEDERINAFLRPLIFDPTEEVQVRSEAIEFLYDRDYQRWLPNWIALLSDPSSDVRFWAAYRLSQYYGNLTSALSALDQLVAFDHSLPRCWGWHADREAIHALENAYMQVWLGYEQDEDGYSAQRYHPWLISPAPEYHTYLSEYRTWTESWIYETNPTPPIVLNVDPDSLADQLRGRWPNVEINARQPRPQAYVLDWRMLVDGQLLSGALHRDRYAVVLTSAHEEAVKTFARWYRGIIPPEQPLFLYEWAGEGEALLP
jgi:hypothetical protein